MKISGILLKDYIRDIDMFLYYVHSKSYPCEAHLPWSETFKREYVCSGYGCNKIIFDKFSDGIDVFVAQKPGISALCSIQPGGVTIARRDFLSLFQDDINQYFKLGNVYNSKEKLLEKYVTYTGTKIILRGTQKSSFNGFCKQCGKPRYLPAYPWHILKDSLLDQPIYECWPLKGLIITEGMKTQIVPGKWKGIYITPIPVVDEPQDGITDIPPHLSDIQFPVNT